MGRDARGLFEELDVALRCRRAGSWPVDGRPAADRDRQVAFVEATVLILDEPTASLSAHEVERLFTIVRRLRAPVSRCCSSATASTRFSSYAIGPLSFATAAT